MLDKMNKAMGRRMPISLAKGNRRPHDPVQAAKFASEAGVAVRSQVPIMTHWKEYKAQSEHFDGFVGRVSMSAYLLVPILHPTLTWPLCNSDFNSNHYGRLAIDTRHEPIADACVSVFKSSIQPRQYKLKQQYFVGIPANEIPTISPISNMVDAQWCQLVDKWSNAHNKVISLDVPPNMYL
jgi:hypothetical protein